MEPFIGEIALFPYSFAPRNWARCDGSLLSIQANTALYSLLGTQFGGDGRETFALPKLQSVPTQGDDGVGYFIALQGVYPSRD